LVNGGRVEYVTDEEKESLYWNIPIANTTSILLGNGTSVTQAAMRELSKAGVMVGFCGGGGTPLYSATEGGMDVLWLSPQSEYRPTEYLQSWFDLWNDDSRRLIAAKKLIELRINFIQKSWTGRNCIFDESFCVDVSSLVETLEQYRLEIKDSRTIADIFSIEAHFTKYLYKMACDTVNYYSFTRVKQGSGKDPANRNLDYGNYLAYGLGATATWVLGLPNSLSMLHGKTRRGGLVFDAADLIKDALVLPQAFISGVNGHSDQEFRANCIRNFLDKEALDYIIDGLKEIAKG
ncbi:type I-F CRISPR-associated endonuclease Cas1f, partial [Chlamydiales bacterium]|nr:type I-F CRISPR-associated endonuclease Cas1f [Chlamydiales bacterium]